MKGTVKMWIKATLRNARRPDYAVVTIPFPIPTDQYDSTIQFFSLEDQRSLVEHYLTVVDWVIRDHIKLNPQVCGLDYSDVHQEGCVHLCRAAAAYTGEPASFGAYAQKVVRNGLIPYCPRSADEARTSPS